MSAERTGMPKLIRGVIHDARAHERYGMRLSMLVCAEPYPQMQAVSRGSTAARDGQVVYAHMASV